MKNLIAVVALGTIIRSRICKFCGVNAVKIYNTKNAIAQSIVGLMDLSRFTQKLFISLLSLSAWAVSTLMQAKEGVSDFSNASAYTFSQAATSNH